jgi:hypothetical protein
MDSICSPEMPRRVFMASIAGGLLAGALARQTPVAVRVVARRVLNSIPAGRTRRIRAAQVRFVGDSLAS